jgi:putative ABC transport system ATP-binding protein
MTGKDFAVEIRNLKFGYDPSAVVLDIPEFLLSRSERIFLYGPSGSGKTTLLGILAGILDVHQGSVKLLDFEFVGAKGSARDAFRATHMGYIFQMFNLIPYLNVRDNIELPCKMNAKKRARIQGASLSESVTQLAEGLGITPFLGRNVQDLSVGQQQRVAAARALLGRPEILIADEPTSALDFDHREQFLKLLFQQCQAVGTSLIFVSHDRSLMPLFERCVALPEINKVGR